MKNIHFDRHFWLTVVLLATLINKNVFHRKTANGAGDRLHFAAALGISYLIVIRLIRRNANKKQRKAH